MTKVASQPLLQGEWVWLARLMIKVASQPLLQGGWVWLARLMTKVAVQPLSQGEWVWLARLMTKVEPCKRVWLVRLLCHESNTVEPPTESTLNKGRNRKMIMCVGEDGPDPAHLHKLRA